MTKQTKSMPKSCPNSKVTMVGTPPLIVGEQSVRYIYAAPCDKWDCAYCGHVKKARWAKRIFWGVKFYDKYEWDFLTITSHRKLTTFEATAAVWPSAWQKLSNKIRYAYNPEYALLPEKHENGRLHGHLIIGNPKARITEKWLKKAASTSGFGWKVDAQELEAPEYAAFYVTKYLTKAIKETEWPVKFRRVRVSQGWPELPPEADYAPLELDWKALLHKEPLEAGEALEALGHKVIYMGDIKGSIGVNE